MRNLSDKIVARLQVEMLAPDLGGTRYRPIRYLARGGMGSIWMVEDSILQRRLALKVLNIASDGSDLAERLLQEARILARLEHPGIVPVHDAGTLADGRPYYCMKYVEGQTLTQQIARLSLAERLRLLGRVAESLEFAHARGVVHRDLKPDNIMVGEFGEVLIMDWGVAKVRVGDAEHAQENVTRSTSIAEQKAETQHGSVLGTCGYMSPEQARGDFEVDHRTDIFSLGALLWFIATGFTPRPDRVPITSIPRQLRSICDKAMAMDPKDRYSSVADLASDVNYYLQGLPVSVHRETIFERVARLYRRHRTAVILLGVYFLMRILFIILSRR